MKKSVLPFLLAALAASPALAEKGKSGAEPAVRGMKSRIVNNVAKPVKVAAAPAEDVMDFAIDDLPNAYSFYTPDAQPFVWDPVSNVLALIKRGGPSVEEGGNLFYRTSEDRGLTWSDPIQIWTGSTTQGEARYPSIQLVNPNNAATSLEGLKIAYTFPLLVGGVDEGGFGPTVFGRVLNGEGSNNRNVTSNAFGHDYDWSTDGKLANSIDGSKVLVARRPNLATDVAPEAANLFSLAILDVASNTWNITFPTQWGPSAFQPSDATTATNPDSLSRKVDMVGLEAGTDGKFYFAIKGQFAAEAVTTYGVSTSSDNGATWTEFAKMPQSLITDMANAVGFEAADVRLVFDNADMTVDANGGVHILSNLSQFEINGDQLSFIDGKEGLFEIIYKDGTWSFKNVTTSGDNTIFTARSMQWTAEGTAAASQMGNELQMLRTADRQWIIAKYLVPVTYPEVENYGDVSTTDVFMLARRVDGGEWQGPFNFTNTLQLERVTWLPKVLPNDLNDVPFLTTHTVIETEDLLIYNDEQRIVDVPQTVNIGIRDISTRFTMGVEDGRTANFNTVVAPNPAGNNARIEFNLPNDGAVRVDVTNLMGQNVITLDKGVMAAGANQVMLNTSNLPAGVYSYSINWNGSVQTGTFSVVR